MTEELLKQIREESKNEITNLEKFNTYSRLRSELEKIENRKRDLGLLYDLYMGIGPAEKTEDDVIMDTYHKYLDHIEEKDTNGIYVHVGTYMALDLSNEEFEKGYPYEIEVNIDDPRATHRYYWDLEGVWSKEIGIEDCTEFERTHTVIYVDNFYEVQRDFIITAVKYNQREAVNKVLKKYKK